MMRRALPILICAAVSVAAQTPLETADILALTGSLRTALRAGDITKAAALSATLRETLRVTRNRALAPRIDEEIDAILGWLPADTETLLVAREPFTADVSAARGGLNALRLAQGYALLPLLSNPAGELSLKLQGQTLRHAVFAARRFQNHEAGPEQTPRLGMIAWQGCGLYGLALPNASPLLSRAPDETLFGFPVWNSKAPGSDPAFMARPKPDLLAVCNDHSFLSDLLGRVGVPQAVRIFPPAGPLMSALDRTAPLWAIRRFLPERAAADPTHPASGGMLGVTDPEAVGVVVEIGGRRGSVSAQWISKSRANPWQQLAALPAVRGTVTIQQNSDGAWQLSAPRDGQNPLVAFTLMGVLGFVAIV